MTKRTKPTKQKNLHRMPTWISSNDYQLINAAEKNLLAYLYRFEPYAGQFQNSQLAKEFHVTRRTIQRRLRKLREFYLIEIENPHSLHRLIYTTGTSRI